MNSVHQTGDKAVRAERATLSEVRLMVTGVRGLIQPKRAAPVLAYADFQRELQRNEGLRVATEAVHRQHIQQLENATVARLRLLRRRSVTSLCLIGSAFLAAIGFVATTDLQVDSVAWGAVSGFIFPWATLGRLGWAGQTINGDTTVERLDGLLFKTMYWIGAFLGSLAAFGSAA